MQANFKEKFIIVENMNECNEIGMKKYFNLALKKAGNLSALQRELVKLGATVSVPALQQATENDNVQRIKIDILASIIAYLGIDWKEVGKELEREYLKK